MKLMFKIILLIWFVNMPKDKRRKYEFFVLYNTHLPFRKTIWQAWNELRYPNIKD